MRASQFIYFINQQKVGEGCLPQYSHIGIGENLKTIRGKYRKDAKQESKRKEKEQEEENARNKTIQEG